MSESRGPDRPDEGVTAAVFEILKTRLTMPDLSMSTPISELDWDTCHAIAGDVIGMVAAEPDVLERLIAAPSPLMKVPDLSGQPVEVLVSLFSGWISAARRPTPATGSV